MKQVGMTMTTRRSSRCNVLDSRVEILTPEVHVQTANNGVVVEGFEGYDEGLRDASAVRGQDGSGVTGEDRREDTGAGESCQEGISCAGDVDGIAVLGKHGCLPCGLKFRDNYNLKRHVQLVHDVRHEPVLCPRPWCQKEFNILAEMKAHLVTCLKVCPSCMKTFDRLDKFTAHQRGHLRMARRMTD